MGGRQKEGGRMERERRMEGGMEEAWGGGRPSFPTLTAT